MDGIDYIECLNDWLLRHGLYPDLEVVEVTGKPQVFVLVDTQEVTAYRSPSGCFRALTMLGDAPVYEEVFQALKANRLSDAEQAQIEYQGPGDDYLWIG